jgi:hypothetical protein
VPLRSSDLLVGHDRDTRVDAGDRTGDRDTGTDLTAEVETPEGLRSQRVVVLRIEDATGIHWMHAPVVDGEDGQLRLSTFYATPDMADPVGQPLLP